MPLPSLTQDAVELAVEWVAGDPISLAFTVLSVDWTGDYTAAVVHEVTGEVVLELTVVATLVDSDTEFLLTAPAVDSEEVLAGDYLWGLREVDGMHRFKGPATAQRKLVP